MWTKNNNNSYPIHIDQSNPIYEHNEVDKYTNKKWNLRKNVKNWKKSI